MGVGEGDEGERLFDAAETVKEHNHRWRTASSVDISVLKERKSHYGDVDIFSQV